MIRLFKSSFAWQFAGGFLIGAAGMLTVHAAQPELPASPYGMTQSPR